MPVIGITGGFGTGKTTVARIFKKLGATVIDADKIVHSQLKKNKKLIKKIISEFGKGILNKRKDIDKRKLSELVFKDRKKLKKLTKIVHPKVISIIKSEAKKNKKRIIIIDAPLLIEAGLQGLVDFIIVVKVPRDIQITRLKKKYKLAEIKLLQRMRAQMPLQDKIRLANFVIDNKGSLSQTEREVRKLWHKIIK